MKCVILTSVSAAIAQVAALTVPNKLEYCLRHGYSLMVENQPYQDAVNNVQRFASYFDQFDMVWTLDADTVITNMTTALHELDCLGPICTVCEENIVPWNYVNCGSVVWRNTPDTRNLLKAIDDAEPVWRGLPCIWQSWLGEAAKQRPDIVTVATTRAFNSVAWTHPGGGEYAPGSHWRPGDFVFHPCGVFPGEERVRSLTAALAMVVR